jgi:hypothetical protein
MLVPNITFVLMILATLSIIIKKSCVLQITIPLLVQNTYFIIHSFNMFILGTYKIFGHQIININHTYLNVNIEDILTILSHCKGTLYNIVSEVY